MFNKEEAIDKLLCFMKDKLESEGCLLNNMWFNFSPLYTQEFFNAEDDVIPEGEDLTEFKENYDISDDNFRKLANVCFTHEYIKHRGSDSELKAVLLTERGFARANSVEKEKDFMPKTSTYNITGPISGNIQIGDNNNQNIQNAITQLMNEIDNMDTTDNQKKEAKGLLNKFLEHPIISNVISAVALKTMGF